MTTNTTIKTVDDLVILFDAAEQAAKKAAVEYFNNKMGGFDGGACGFAWVNLYKFNDKKLDGRTKMGRLLKQAGVRQDWQRNFQIWNPAKFGCQNIDTLEAGARAYAEVLREAGFEAYMGSRLD